MGEQPPPWPLALKGHRVSSVRALQGLLPEHSPLREGTFPPETACPGPGVGVASWPEQWGGMSLSGMQGGGHLMMMPLPSRSTGDVGMGAGGPSGGSGIIGGHSSALFL